MLNKFQRYRRWRGGYWGLSDNEWYEVSYTSLLIGDADLCFETIEDWTND